MSEERLDALEQARVRHESAIESIAQNIQALVKQGERTQIQNERTQELMQQALLRDERFDGKLRRLEETVFARLDTQHDTITRAHMRVDRVDSVIARIAWTIVTAVLIAVLSVVVVVK
jgi:ABC-type multidrug transport system fused ATPase/permease subunit